MNMAQLLSPSELDLLLAGISVRGTSQEAFAASGPAIPSLRARARNAQIAPDLLHGFRAIHTAYAAELATVWSSLLSTRVEVRLQTVDPAAGADIAATLENPTCCHLVQARPLAGPLLFDIGAAIGIALVDRLLGGTQLRVGEDHARAMTSIERRLLGRPVAAALEALRKSWGDICELESHIANAELDPRLLPIAEAEEAVLLATFEISVGDRQGPLHVGVPLRALEPVQEKLAQYRRGTATSPGQSGDAPAAADGMVRIVAVLAEARLPAADIAGLAVGDVIATDCVPTEAIRVRLGAETYLGFPGQLQGQKAVRISQTRSPEAGQPAGPAGPTLSSSAAGP